MPREPYRKGIVPSRRLSSFGGKVTFGKLGSRSGWKSYPEGEPLLDRIVSITRTVVLSNHPNYASRARQESKTVCEPWFDRIDLLARAVRMNESTTEGEPCRPGIIDRSRADRVGNRTNPASRERLESLSGCESSRSGIDTTARAVSPWNHESDASRINRRIVRKPRAMRKANRIRSASR